MTMDITTVPRMNCDLIPALGIKMALDCMLYMLHLCLHQQFAESMLLLRVPTQRRKSMSMISSKEIKFECPNFVLDQLGSFRVV